MPKGFQGFQKGNIINLGRKFGSKSLEVRKKLSEAGKRNKNLFQQGHEVSTEHREKIGKAHKGENSWNWKNGRVKNGDGYIYILIPEHPFACKSGYIFEHRLVMEKFLGRYLTHEEVIHHINEIVDDNRIENLILFANSIKHTNYHKMLREKLA